MQPSDFLSDEALHFAPSRVGRPTLHPQADGRLVAGKALEGKEAKSLPGPRLDPGFYAGARLFQSLGVVQEILTGGRIADRGARLDLADHG